MRPFQLPRWRFSNCCGHYWGHRPPATETVEGAGRREFIKMAAAGVAALGSLPGTTAGQVRVFPPPPPAVSPVEGLIGRASCRERVFRTV